MRLPRPSSLPALLLSLLVTTGALAHPTARRDLGGFSLQLPAGLSRQAGGIDSHAGRLVGEALTIDYDLGAQADALQPREGISGRQERAVIVDGRPARLVSWRVDGPPPAAPRYFIGLHLPRVADSVMGPVRLTLLGQVLDPAKLAEAEAILMSLRVDGAVAPER